MSPVSTAPAAEPVIADGGAPLSPRGRRQLLTESRQLDGGAAGRKVREFPVRRGMVGLRRVPTAEGERHGTE